MTPQNSTKKGTKIQIQIMYEKTSKTLSLSTCSNRQSINDFVTIRVFNA